MNENAPHTRSFGVKLGKVPLRLWQRLSVVLWLGSLRGQAVSFFDGYPVEPGDVAMVGDSLTAGAEWSEMFPGVPIKNRGFPGDTTRDVLDRIDQVTDGRPAKIFLLVGTNDLFYREEVAEVLETYKEILGKIEANSPATRIYIQSVLPRHPDYREKIVTLNRELKILAENRGHPYVDLYTPFLGPDGGVAPELSNDQLHLLGPGYELWRKSIAHLVRDGD